MNRRPKKLPPTVVALATALATPLALAHPGTHGDAGPGAALLAGLVHPFAGADHLAAMIAVGAWTALCLGHRGRAMWAVPLAFAALMLAGAALGIGGAAGIGGVALPMAEPMIAASLLVFGLLVAGRVRLALPLGAALAGGFAIFHGLAHGIELRQAWAPAALAGIAAGTLVLHGIGIAAGRLMVARTRWLPGAAGVAVAALGLRMLAA